MIARPAHLPVLDGLRAIAVLLVLWSHVPPHTPGYPEWLLWSRLLVEPGGFGVEIFFVLSGFLITRILIAERAALRPVRYFMARRLLRIFPIYYLLLAILFVVDPHPEFLWCAVYLGNWLTVTTPGIDFPLQHTWSLCVEEHFYLLWPLVVAFTAPRRPVAVLLIWLPLALAAALFVGYWTTDLRHAFTATQHCSPIRFFSLGAGCLLAYAEPALTGRPRRMLVAAVILLVPGIAANNVLQFALLPNWLDRPVLLPHRAGPALWLLSMTALATAVLLVCLASSAARWSPVRLLTTWPFVAIGRISYGIYLYHLPIFRALLRPTPTGGRVALAIGLTLVAATASYWLLERPILRYGRRLR